MFFYKKGSKKSAMLTKLVAVFMAGVIFSLLTGAMFDDKAKNVTLVMYDGFAGGEKTQELTTRQDIVADFLEENGVTIGQFDKISVNTEDELSDGAEIVIKRGRPYTLNIDGRIEFLTATEKTVGEALTEAGVVLSENDHVEPELSSEITEDISITVFRVSNSEISEDIQIAFEKKEVKDSTLEKGKTKIKVKGQNGIVRKTYSIKTVDGAETQRELISEVTVKEPVAQVTAVGTKTSSKKVKTASGKSLNYSKKLTMTATAYTATGNRTASGKPAQYGVIAVDPKVIPLGTKLYIESTDDGKSWKYGYCVAGDTGGAIKGNKIDLYYNSKSECLQFGRRSAIVYILD